MTGPRLPLDQAFGTPEAKRRYTRRLFATIAERYDVITRVLSFGRDQAWKVDLIARAGISLARARSIWRVERATWRFSRRRVARPSWDSTSRHE